MKEVTVGATKTYEKLIMKLIMPAYGYLNCGICTSGVHDGRQGLFRSNSSKDGYIGFIPQRVSYKPYDGKSLMGGYAA